MKDILIYYTSYNIIVQLFVTYTDRVLLILYVDFKLVYSLVRIFIDSISQCSILSLQFIAYKLI
jgi:hypothetical protein